MSSKQKETKKETKDTKEVEMKDAVPEEKKEVKPENPHVTLVNGY